MIEKHNRRGVISKRLLVAVCATCIFLGGQTAFANHESSENYSTAGIEQQKVIIKGLVKESNGTPIIGASVAEIGTTNGTITDIDGNFSISVNKNSTLKISFIGYKTITVKAKEGLVVTLQEDSEILDEVVVVGYGAQKKESLTGAVSTVKVNETLSSRPIADAGRGLQGAVSGLQVSVPTGEVGSDPIMKIRGQVASIEGSSSPLILVDNVEIPSIQMINPDDIESISVLKDAASASIYGAKGAFGVILITTKQGSKTDKFEISYSNNFSWQNPTKNIRMAGIEGLEYTVDAQKNRGAAMPAGGFWRVDEDSLEKMREWQTMHGSAVVAYKPGGSIHVYASPEIGPDHVRIPGWTVKNGTVIDYDMVERNQNGDLWYRIGPGQWLYGPHLSLNQEGAYKSYSNSGYGYIKADKPLYHWNSKKHTMTVTTKTVESAKSKSRKSKNYWKTKKKKVKVTAHKGRVIVDRTIVQGGKIAIC